MNFWEIFGFSFLVALTGALSPGPLLTYTIFNSIKAKEKGILVGLMVSAGHAILELALIMLIFSGVGPFLENQIVVILIGLIGGLLLFYFGASVLIDLKRDRIDFSFLKPDEEKMSKSMKKNKLLNMHPILGGIVVSLSNPYWILWWVTWGLNAMTTFSVSLSNPLAFWGFFLGHELGDMAWYLPIATIVGFSSKIMTKKVYIVILICCSIFMIGFGGFLALSPLL